MKARGEKRTGVGREGKKKEEIKRRGKEKA
jgi:hypothetical protein